MSSASSTSGCAEKGQLGFVVIPLGITRDCHRGSNAHHVFWPALLFPSSEALRRCLPSQHDVHMFNTEWRDHQMKRIGAWGQPGIPPPISEEHGPPMKAAFLLGSEIPPSGTRSFPVYSQDVTMYAGGTPQKPSSAFTKKLRKNMRKVEPYSNDDRFLEALEIAERYNTNGNLNQLISSINWPLSPHVHGFQGQQPPHRRPDPSVIPTAAVTFKGASAASAQNVGGNMYAPSASDNTTAFHTDTTSTTDMQNLVRMSGQSGGQCNEGADDEDDESVVNLDSSGAYNVPTPSRDGFLSQANKSALREVAVEGPSAASGRNVSGDNNSRVVGGACGSSDGHDGDADEEIEEEAQSPQRPKQIDFGAADVAGVKGSLPVGSSTTASTSRACRSGDKKHVRFDAAASSAPITRDGAAHSSTVPTTNAIPSSGPPAVKTEAAVARTSRQATPSPVQGDGDTKSMTEEKMRDNATAITNEERYKRLRGVIKPDMDWPLVLPTLRDRGWVVKPGTGLISYYYCCSKFADESVAYIEKHAKRGDEYFGSEEELETFCREKLGWVGSGSDSGERRRGRTGASGVGDSEAKKQQGTGRPKREVKAKPEAFRGTSSSVTTKKKLAASVKRNGTSATRVRAVTGRHANGSISDRSDSSDSSFGKVPLTPCTKKQRSALLKAASGADRAKRRSGPGGAASKVKAAAKKKKKKQSGAKAKGKKPSGSKKGKEPTGEKKKKIPKVPPSQTAVTLTPSADLSLPSPSSPAKSTEDSNAGPETILQDQTAWGGFLIPVFKFRYNKGFYCLPGIDPKSSETKEGEDYFKRVTGLRRHLCAYGIPLTALASSSKGKTGGCVDGKRRKSRRDVTSDVDTDSLMNKDDLLALERWVRYAVSRLLALKTEVPADIERFPPKSFMNGPWQLLQKLGYKYSSGTYKVPTGQGAAISFHRAEDLEAHLARFGLVEDTSALNPEDLLKLELYIAGYSNVDLFQRTCPEDQDHTFLKQPAVAPISSSTGTSPAKEVGSGLARSTTDMEKEQEKIGTATDSPPSPSSLQTVKAPDADEECVTKQPSETTPKIPQELIFSRLASTSSSVLSENSFNPSCPNGIPEVGDDEGRNAVKALSLDEEADTVNGQEEMLGEDDDDDIVMNQRDEDDDDDDDDEEKYCNSSDSAADSDVKDAQLGAEAKPNKRAVRHTAAGATAIRADSASDSGGQNENSSSRKRGASGGRPRTADVERTTGSSQSNKKARKSSSGLAQAGGPSDPDFSPHTTSGNAKLDDEATEEALPDRQVTVSEKLRCCQSILHSDHVDDMYSKSSRVENHANAIAEFLNEAMGTSYERGGGESSTCTFEPSSMYVCGGPGTGKTTTLNKCINKCRGEFPDARFIFCNATSCGHDGQSAAKRILNDIKNEIHAGPEGEEASYAKVEKYLASRRTSPLVLVLDEIDMLLSYSNRSIDKLSGGDMLIKNLLNWAANPECSFVVIGISNAVDNGYTERLQSLGRISHTLVFKPYKEEDLISIIEARVGTKIIAEPAIKMVSRKVAAGSGDARKALDMTAQAVRKCETDLSVEQLGRSGDDIVYPIVKLPHMMRSIREGLGMKHTDAIMSMPQAAKIVLCVAVALSTVSPAWKVIKMKDLKKYCSEASRHGLMERLNIDHLFDIVQMLSDSGLLLSGNGSDLRYAAYQMDVHEIPLMLGVQLDDVECALERTLMNEPFYKGMVNYVKKHHR